MFRPQNPKLGPGNMKIEPSAVGGAQTAGLVTTVLQLLRVDHCGGQPGHENSQGLLQYKVGRTNYVAGERYRRSCDSGSGVVSLLHQSRHRKAI